MGSSGGITWEKLLVQVNKLTPGDKTVGVKKVVLMVIFEAFVGNWLVVAWQTCDSISYGKRLHSHKKSAPKMHILYLWPSIAAETAWLLRRREWEQELCVVIEERDGPYL